MTTDGDSLKISKQFTSRIARGSLAGNTPLIPPLLTSGLYHSLPRACRSQFVYCSLFVKIVPSVNTKLWLIIHLLGMQTHDIQINKGAGSLTQYERPLNSTMWQDGRPARGQAAQGRGWLIGACAKPQQLQSLLKIPQNVDSPLFLDLVLVSVATTMSASVGEPFHRVRSEPAFNRTLVGSRRDSIDTGVGSRVSSSGASSAGSSSPVNGSALSLAPPKTLPEKIAVSGCAYFDACMNVVYTYEVCNVSWSVLGVRPASSAEETLIYWCSFVVYIALSIFSNYLSMTLHASELELDRAIAGRIYIYTCTHTS